LSEDEGERKRAAELLELYKTVKKRRVVIGVASVTP